ncbi:hypothetical protein EJO50_15635 [Iodobacter ciconiae]|uniref:Uncharacterized protein n=1 Tax=Iodobacter ciconiae TaxID=2496266 RepID=A0A3S8ZWB5_9NEIS|nr:hypothetical protein EJO50_15635 [Iodobacter ciconiae]
MKRQQTLGGDAADEAKVEITKLQRDNQQTRQINDYLQANPEAQRRAGVSTSDTQDLIGRNNEKIAENNKIIEEYRTGRRVRLLYTGQEPYRMYGYLRWRHIFSAAG